MQNVPRHRSGIALTIQTACLTEQSGVTARRPLLVFLITSDVLDQDCYKFRTFCFDDATTASAALVSGRQEGPLSQVHLGPQEGEAGRVGSIYSLQAENDSELLWP